MQIPKTRFRELLRDPAPIFPLPPSSCEAWVSESPVLRRTHARHSHARKEKALPSPPPPPPRFPTRSSAKNLRPLAFGRSGPPVGAVPPP